MSVSEGQPALTPDQENELRLYAMRPEGHGLRVSRAAVAGVLAELAREREARQEVERLLKDARRFHSAEFHDRRVAEGRVRALRKYVSHGLTCGIAKGNLCDCGLSEALVGLPERREP